MTVLDEIATQMVARLDYLRPAFDEYNELSEALAKLNGSAKAPAKSNGKRKRGRPRGTGRRPQQVLEVVRKSPGLRTSQISDRIGVGNTYLYRVMPILEADGQITQAPDKTWHPAKRKGSA